jgi:hypothetical protein
VERRHGVAHKSPGGTADAILAPGGIDGPDASRGCTAGARNASQIKPGADAPASRRQNFFADGDRLVFQGCRCHLVPAIEKSKQRDDADDFDNLTLAPVLAQAGKQVVDHRVRNGRRSQREIERRPFGVAIEKGSSGSPRPRRASCPPPRCEERRRLYESCSVGSRPHGSPDEYAFRTAHTRSSEAPPNYDEGCSICSLTSPLDLRPHILRNRRSNPST